MNTVLWTVAVVLICTLLVFSTYAAFFGFAGVLSGARYVTCPQCHHHYLRTRASSQHPCPHGVAEKAYQAAWRTTHHELTDSPVAGRAR